MTEAGGPSGESIEQGYLNPFTENSGIAVVRENPSGLGKLRAMVEAGAVTSVVLELSSHELEQAKALDLVEPLDWDAIDPTLMFEEAKDEKGYGYQYYSTIMAWREDVKAPQSWQDFWDVEAFRAGGRCRTTLPTSCRWRCLPTAFRSRSSTRSTSTARSRAWRRSRTTSRCGGRRARSRRSSCRTTRCSTRSPGRAGSPARRASPTASRTASSTSPSSSCPRAPTRSRRRRPWHLLLNERAREPGGRRRRGLLHRQRPDLKPLLPKDRIDEFPTTAANKEVQSLSDARWWFETAEEVEARWQEFKLGLRPPGRRRSPAGLAGNPPARRETRRPMPKTLSHRAPGSAERPRRDHPGEDLGLGPAAAQRPGRATTVRSSPGWSEGPALGSSSRRPGARPCKHPVEPNPVRSGPGMEPRGSARIIQPKTGARGAPACSGVPWGSSLTRRTLCGT